VEGTAEAGLRQLSSPRGADEAFLAAVAALTSGNHFRFAAGFFAVLAAIWPTWIEAFGVDPDRGDGSLEWAIGIVLAAVAWPWDSSRAGTGASTARRPSKPDSGGTPWT
jgi:hypothetical protein